MLSVDHLTLKFGERLLFGDVNFKLQAGQRAALAGRNGQGKSTLFRVLTGDMGYDQGQITLNKGATIGYLPQDIQPPEDDRTVLEETLEGIPGLRKLEREITRLTEKMAEDTSDAVMEAYGKAQAKFEALDGYAAEAKAATILDGLGFTQERIKGPCRNLSGGWLMRTQLARLLLMSPDLLLLDEPTNHLDLETTEWLLSFLQGYQGALLLTSHDRYFLDELVGKVFELESGRLDIYTGNYSAYEVEKVERLRRLKAAHARQQKELARQQTFIEKNRARASTASNVQSRIKQVEKIERIELPPEPPEIKLRFPEPDRAGAVALKLRNLGKAYGEHVVFDGLELEVERGSKLVVTGVNGAGKTTLLNMIAQRLDPSSGKVVMGHNVAMQYFSQYEDDIRDTSQTLLHAMEEVAPLNPLHNPRTVLGCFLFTGDDVFKTVGVLSGGERARLKMARMLMQPSNLLVLDEPTNHLDIHSKDILLKALQAYQGTLVFVSHDRHFIEALATSVLEIKGGQTRFFPCDYTQYRWRLAQDAAAAAAAAAAAQPKQPDQPTKAADKNPTPGQLQKAQKKLLRKAQQKADAAQAQVEALEARQRELESLMSSPGFYDSDDHLPVVQEHKTLIGKIESSYEAFEAAMVEVDALERA